MLASLNDFAQLNTKHLLCFFHLHSAGWAAGGGRRGLKWRGGGRGEGGQSPNNSCFSFLCNNNSLRAGGNACSYAVEVGYVPPNALIRDVLLFLVTETRGFISQCSPRVVRDPRDTLK